VPRGSSPHFLASEGESSSRGHLVYGLGNQLLAAPFDAGTLTLDSAAVPVMSNVEMRANGDAAQFGVSDTGSIVALEASQAELVNVDRSGNARSLSSARRRFAMPRFSPDGQTLAVEIQDTPHQIWLLDIGRDVLTPLTRSPGGSHNMAWAPDGKSIAVTVAGGAQVQLQWMRTDGSGESRTLFAEDGPWINDWSRDGRWLALLQGRRSTRRSILLPVESANPPRVTGPPTSLSQPGRVAEYPRVSPNGLWVAYIDAGQTNQVFVERLADHARFQVSTDGGTQAVWSTNSRELYFRSGTHFFAANIGGDGRPVGRPQALFEDTYQHWAEPNFDVSPDGTHFVMVRSASDAAATHLNLQMNWVNEVRRLAPGATR
jgi:hypothetical protein